MEHRLKANAPRILLRRALLDQNRDSAIHGLGYLGITFRAKDRACSGVRVDEGDVFGGQGEVAIVFI